MTGHRLFPLLMVVACHGPIATSGSGAHRHGTIREPSGARSGPGIWITITDLTSGSMSVMKTDAAGEFDFALPPGRYAFAVTSSNGFAFLEQDVTSTDQPVVTLSSNCHRVRGHVSGELGSPATVTIPRSSRNTGDRFVVTVGDDGQFVACLPEGSFVPQADSAIVSLPQPVTVPTDKVIEIVAYARSRVQQVPNDIRIGAADFATFARSLTDRRVIGLGEANHGTGDFYTYRGKLSLELASKGKLRIVLFEADAIGMLAIEDYVMGGDVDIDKSVPKLRFWITDIREFLAFLAGVRAHNARSPKDDKLHVLGIDAQRVEPPVQFLLAHRAELKISDREAGLLTQVAPEHGAAFAKLSTDDREVLSALLDRLAAMNGPTELADPVARASIAARSIAYQLGYLGEFGTVRQRDQAMAEIAAHIVALSGSRQVAVWGHNGHIARQSDGADKSLGQFLAEKFGDGYYPIGFLSYRGAGRAWDAGGKIGVIPHDLEPAPPYNVEAVIMKAAGFVDVAWVRLDSAGGALKEWLATPRYVREFGSVYIAQDTQALRPFPGAISAVVVVQNGKASSPTPTGVRKVAR
jgi:erythromycin esterase